MKLSVIEIGYASPLPIQRTAEIGCQGLCLIHVNYNLNSTSEEIKIPLSKIISPANLDFAINHQLFQATESPPVIILPRINKIENNKVEFVEETSWTQQKLSNDPTSNVIEYTSKSTPELTVSIVYDAKYGKITRYDVQFNSNEYYVRRDLEKANEKLNKVNDNKEEKIEKSFENQK